MKKVEIAISMVFLLWSVIACSETHSAFDWLKTLTGNWQGSYKWSGGRSGGGEMTATYSLTANGSAVVENLIVGADPVMTSVYHLDGDTLRMTHFCAAGNQPRLRAKKIDGVKRSVHFELVDITNLAGPKVGHVHKFEIHFKDENHINLIFTFLRDALESQEFIELSRGKK
ncbi:hypothetical protein L0222_32010 [bacterium]|nr:hypothetical protein [bacterium]MCI0607188.1 hypothetical protein [bacterium]